MIQKIGVAAVIWNEKGQVLLGLRKSSLGTGTWGFPGGHVEVGEHPAAATIRETKEETDLDIVVGKLLGVVSTWHEDIQTQYFTLFYTTDSYEGTLKVLENHKCAGWEWFDPFDLPKPLFEPVNEIFVQDYAKEMNLA